MWDYMIKRALMSAEYILETGATVRDCAERFGTSKSTVHKDVSERLQEIDFELYCKVREVLDKNLREPAYPRRKRDQKKVRKER